jgi:hypothetical protein
VELAVFERKLGIEYASVLNENPVLFVCNTLVFFGLKVQVSIGERMLVGLATGTAVFLTPLPMPPVPKVSAGNSWDDDKKLAEIQKLLQDTVKKNREIYQLKPVIVRRRLIINTLYSCMQIYFFSVLRILCLFLSYL